MIHPILPTLYLPNKNVKNENGHHQFNLFINDNTGLNKIDKHNENPGRIDENNENPPIIGSNDEYYVNPRRTSESVRSKDDNEDNVITLSDDDNEMIVDKDAEILEKLKRLESVEELDETIIEDSNDQSISKLTTQTITIDDQPKPGTSSSTITISDEYHVNDRLQQKPGTSSTILSTITIDDAVQQKTISTSQTITIDGDENVSKKESSPVVIINDQENSQLSSVSVVNDNDNEEIINENMMITTFVNISNI
ncbi:uncharacterized protein LOC123301799 [Chrysoperla carnea]|uniref:uncharacterized protein LOC123301799 n=1 Tax=Chrysoperla carnea TaxID=189513 RepID=UPI001D05DB6E|nr:uncharacterized protein LOC123301799 [Chrysoperla carnea]